MADWPWNALKKLWKAYTSHLCVPKYAHGMYKCWAVASYVFHCISRDVANLKSTCGGGGGGGGGGSWGMLSQENILN